MYDYQPLGENSIRLFQIQPALRNGLVACILNQFDDHVPPYSALSYYWGDPKPTRKTYVNNSIFEIHEALWEFLDQMQQSEETDNWIWTDLLCLNQRDNTEMGHQIPRMGYIYSKAVRTISWLGYNKSSWVSGLNRQSIPSYDLEEDIKLIAEKMVAERAAVKGFFAHPKLVCWTEVMKIMLGNYHKLPYLESNSSPVSRRLTSSDLPLATSEVWQLSFEASQRTANILSLPYWTRAWIAQEVALPKEATLVFGKASLDFDDFLLIYKSHCYCTWQAFGSIDVKLRVPMEARAVVHENTNITFQQILKWGQNCKASKTVDRIYGLLGLLERCGDVTDTLPSIVAQPIDYSRDKREVYWEIALTYHPPTDFSGITDHRYRKVITEWLDYLPGWGESLSCPFTRESLQCADNDHATVLCRNKARIALCVVDICREVVMANTSTLVRLRDPITPGSWIQARYSVPPGSCNSSWSSILPEGSWPTKLCARQLWAGPLDDHSFSRWQEIQLLLSTLLMETNETQGMDEDEKYQAVLIGLRIADREYPEGKWNCVPQSMEGPLGHSIEVRFECIIWLASSHLPCSSLSTTPSASSFQTSHQCQTSDRYLIIERKGWRLSLKDLHYVREEEKWRGSLNVEY